MIGIAIGLQIELRTKQSPAAEAQAHHAGGVIALQLLEPVPQRRQPSLLLVELVAARGLLLELGDHLDRLGDPRLGFVNERRPPFLDRIDLALEADFRRVELASGDAEAHQELALDVVARLAGLQGSEQAAFHPPVQFGASR